MRSAPENWEVFCIDSENRRDRSCGERTRAAICCYADGVKRRTAGWQSTIAGAREVKLALRRTLYKYKLHQYQDLFDRAYAYIEEYY